METTKIIGLVQKDAIAAGYGIVAGTVRKAANKVLGEKGVGQNGLNAISFVAGMGLSHINNPHIKIVGSALRISGLAGIGNSLIEKALSKKDKSE